MSPQVESVLEQGGISWKENETSSRLGKLLVWIGAATQTIRKFYPLSIKRQNSKLRPTAYLDGMRGFGALLVYILHHEGWAHDSLKADTIFENGFGYNKQYYFACLPGIRLFFSGGHLAVAVFFIVSGYVLSLKPLQLLLISNDRVQFGENLASALFRRWIRLFTPLIATSFIYMTLNYLIHDLSTTKAEAKYRDEAFKWYVELKEFSFIFRLGGEPWLSYNYHAWSIPFEFKGSIVIYTSLLAFSRCTKNARLWCQVALVLYFLYIVDGWYCALFVTGMLLCELDILANSERHSLPAWLTECERFKNGIFMTLFIIGLYLGGVPSLSLDIENIRNAPGWYYLSFLKPQAMLMPKAFYLYWAATFITVAVPRISWLRTFFECSFNQYLGKVSYGFYLIHGPVLWTIGDRVYAAVGWARASHALNGSNWVNTFRLPHFGPLGLEFNFLMAHLLLFPLTLWLAKVVTSCIDEPSIRLAQWVFQRVVQQTNEPRKLEK